MKRSCNSSIKVEDDRIIFNSFVLTIDKTRYKEFKKISKDYLVGDIPDRNARVLEHIIELALVHYGRPDSLKEADQ